MHAKDRLTRFVPLSVLFASVGAVAVVAHDADAQPRTIGIRDVATKQESGPPSLNSASLFANDMRKGGDVATSGALDGVPLLAGFRFHFNNLDHKMLAIGVLATTTSSAKVSFSDINGDDPFNVGADWLIVKNTGSRGQTKAAGAGQFEIPLPPHGDQRVALTGFDFSPEILQDHDVRMIGVWIDEGRNAIRVSFLDDRDPEAGNLATRIGNGGGPDGRAGTFCGTMNTPAEMSAAQGKCQAITNPQTSPTYFVTVQYALLPRDTVEMEDYFTGTGTTPSSNKSFPGRGVLQGFEFYFDGHDHFIHDIGIYSPLAAGVIHQHPAAFPTPPTDVVEFEDKNPHTPKHWAAKFLGIKNLGH